MYALVSTGNATLNDVEADIVLTTRFSRRRRTDRCQIFSRIHVCETHLGSDRRTSASSSLDRSLTTLSARGGTRSLEA